MKFKIKEVKLSSGGPLIGILNNEDALKLDLRALDRIKVKKDSREQVIAIDIAKSKRNIYPGQLGLFDEVMDVLRLKDKDIVEISIEPKPLSLEFIKKKLDGFTLDKMEIDEIVKDIVENKLTEIEITYFVSACYRNGMSIYESAYLTEAIVAHGKKLNLKHYPILDKHSLGGVPGNRVTMILVPIIAAAGYIIPKTSTRSITSCSGTSDTMEVLAPVEFHVDDIKKIVKKTNAAMVWGGVLELASADDRLIKIEKVLSLDPEGILLASILAKKNAVGATHVVLDIPIGKECKLKHKKDARRLKRKFELLGKLLGINIKAVITDGSQPIGYGIGPALEARDVLYLLQNNKEKMPKDLRKKSILMATALLQMVGVKNANKKVIDILDSGKAYEKMKEVIMAQGGNSKIQPEQIKIGKFKYIAKAKQEGSVKEISNKYLTKIAKAAGAPTDKGAGIYIPIKLNDKVKIGQTLFTIFAENEKKLEFAIKIYNNSKVVNVEK